MSLFDIFKFPASSVPRTSRCSAGGHYRGHCRRDITGAQDKVREEQILERRCMVSPSVARGYRFCYTREYRQGG
ncbi:unnamed protein product, partial [Staurois parvus]